MGYLSLIVCLLMVGCSYKSPEIRNTYEKGYRSAAKIEMDALASKMSNREVINYYWHKPLVQEVEVPSHVENGAFIPSHKEFVIIKPGQWVNEGYYPNKQQEKMHDNNEISPDISAKSIDNSDSTDITALPIHRR